MGCDGKGEKASRRWISFDIICVGIHFSSYGLIMRGLHCSGQINAGHA